MLSMLHLSHKTTIIAQLFLQPTWLKLRRKTWSFLPPKPSCNNPELYFCNLRPIFHQFLNDVSSCHNPTVNKQTFSCCSKMTYFPQFPLVIMRKSKQKKLILIVYKPKEVLIVSPKGRIRSVPMISLSHIETLKYDSILPKV